MQEKIKNLIKESLKNLGLEEVNFVVEHPEDLKNGDYSTNVAMISKISPEKIVEELKSALIREDLGGFIEKIEIKNGFINFYLSKEFFVKSVGKILEQKENFGRSNVGNKEKIIVEYSSPNIAKPFTIGHLRSTIIGDAISNILSFTGYEVIRDNHIGDWGTQFGKLIVAIKKWGNLEEIEKNDAPIKLLVDLYVKFHEEAEKEKTLEDEARAWFLKLEQKDSEATDIWKRCIEISKKEFKKIYKKLNVSPFNTEHGESFFEDKMQEVLDDIKQKKLGKESEGAFIIEFPEEKKLSPLLLLKKDGSSLYGLRDLATDKWRKKEYGNEIKIINEVGSEQTEYFRQIFEAEKMLGYFKEGQRNHIAHGLYRFKDGKMSTRKGNVIWLEDIIEEAEKRAGEINEETKEEVAIGALKFNDLKRESLKDIVFDMEEILNIKGDSGPYLQYSYARAKSILEKAVAEKVISSKKLPENWQTIDLEKMLYQFPEIVLRSAREFQAHHIATYLINLAREFSSFYGEGKIVDSKDETSIYKVALTEAFSIVIKNGLHLLGIQALERM
ncbi:MAG: arginine--tRNA ligase [Candidatus Paceibacterota bacterium]